MKLCGGVQDIGMNRWFEKERFTQLFKKDNMMILILAGVLLFVIALPVKKEKSDEKGLSTEQSETAAGLWGTSFPAESNPSKKITGQNDTLPAGQGDLAYTKELEERLTEVLSGMSGVGKVRVMITLKSSSELVVEKEKPVSRSSTNETDAQGGNRQVDTGEYGETVIYSTSGSASEPYVIMTYVPRIEGVLVVAEGAGSGTINKNITEAVCALFDVEAHKIKVVKMEQQSD